MGFQADGKVTNFEKAREQAIQVVRSAPHGDAFSVVLMSSPSKIIVTEPSENPDRVVAEIEKLRLPHTGADLGGALTSVTSLLRESPAKFPRKEVFFFTDMQYSTWVAQHSTALNPLLQIFKDRKVDTIFVDVGQDEAANLAVTSLTIGDDAATTLRPTTLMANLHNYGVKARDDVQVRFWYCVAGGEWKDGAPHWNEIQTEKAAAVGAGQDSLVTVKHTFTTPGDYVVKAEVTVKDKLDLDDVRYAAIRVRKYTPVLLVNGRPFGSHFDQSTAELRTSLNPKADDQTPPANVTALPKVITPADFAHETRGDLTPYDCVFLCDVPSIAETEAKRLETFVRRGGGLIICLGGQVQAADYNRVLFRDGMSLLPAPLFGPSSRHQAYHFKFSLGSDTADFREPPLKAFANTEDQITLGAPRFSRFYEFYKRKLTDRSISDMRDKGVKEDVLSKIARLKDQDFDTRDRLLRELSQVLDKDELEQYRELVLQSTETAEIKTPVKPRRVLTLIPETIPGKESEAANALQPRGGPLVLEWQPPLKQEAKDNKRPPPGRMRGRVVLIAAPVNSDWSNWPVPPSYPALMQELFKFAASGRLREQSLDAGRPLEQYLTIPAGGVTATVYTPDNRQEKPVVTDLDEGSILRFPDTDISGVYRVVVNLRDKTEEYLFAVNVPVRNDDKISTECDLKRTNLEEMTRVWSGLDYLQVVNDAANRVARPTDTSAKEELFYQPIGTDIAHWLLLAVLALVFLEVIFAWLFAHHTGIPAAEETATIRKTTAWEWALRFSPWVLFVVLAGMAAILVHDSLTRDFLGFLPEDLRRWSEQALKVPPPAPGEKTMWRLEYTSYLWSDKFDPWLVGLAGVIALALVVFVYHQERGRATTADRFLLGGLRLGLLALLLGAILPQLRLWFDRQSWPSVVVLVDDSFSMSARERYGDPADKAAADRLAKEAESMAAAKFDLAGQKEQQAVRQEQAADQLTANSPERERLLAETNTLREQARNLHEEAGALKLAREGGDVERLQLVCALLTRADGHWLATLLTQREFKVHIYRCANQTARVASMTQPSQLPEGIQAVQSLSAVPGNDASHLGAAVRQVIKDFRGSGLAAVVMLTDGVTTEGEETIAQASQAATDAGVPLYFVGVGDAHEVRDVYLQGLKAEDLVFVKDELVFDLYVVAKGYKNLTVPVILREKGGKELKRQDVKIDDKGLPVKVKLVYQPMEPGEKIYEIEIPKQEGEVETSNNRVEHNVSVRESALIKVLYVEGYRRYEYHFLKTLLERESNRVKGNRSIKLRVRLMDADAGYQAAEGKDTDGEWRVLNDFPTRKELEGYHVIILGDVDPKPDRNPEKMHEFLKNVADFVDKTGGGLLMIAGEHWSPRAYRDSPLKDVLPIEMVGEAKGEEPDRALTRGYRPELTPVGREHPLFRFRSKNDVDTDDIWNKLKEFYWHAEGFRAKRVAEVLAVYPGNKKEERPGDIKDPLVVQQFIGSGRAMFFGFNETWRWGWREDQGHYNQFWIQAVRYLARSRLGRVRLDLDKQAPYRRGEPIRVSVRFPDDAPPPENATVTVKAERRNRAEGGAVARWELTLTKLPGSRATYEDIITQTPEGDYKFWLEIPPAWKAKLDSANYTPRAECRVVGPPDELYGLRMNATEMKQAAEDTNGGFYTLADADKLPDDLPKGEPGPRSPAGAPLLLWNGAICFGVALLLLTTEWLIRKRKNLL